MPPRQQWYWPLPGIEKILPAEGDAGCFWEDRGDRRHGGIDLYAPPGSGVTAIEDGEVISTGLFTSPDQVPYWNRTYQVTIAHTSGIFCRYAELRDTAVEPGVSLSGGDLVGHVGEVLSLSLVGQEAPPYIRSLKEHGHGSMLHFEAYSSVPVSAPGYRGGNWFTRGRPANLLDPVPILRNSR